MQNIKTIRGDLNASDLRVVIVAARFNELVVESLIKGALDTLRSHGASDRNIALVRVPGAIEMGLALEKTAAGRQYDAIVALAAVIIPNVASFANKGDTGAQAAENDNIQAGIDAMMADKGITAVTALAGPATSTQAWSALPAGTGAAALFPVYLREATTKYFYCYDGTGLVTQQDIAGSAACP